MKFYYNEFAKSEYSIFRYSSYYVHTEPEKYFFMLI